MPRARPQSTTSPAPCEPFAWMPTALELAGLRREANSARMLIGLLRESQATALFAQHQAKRLRAQLKQHEQEHPAMPRAFTTTATTYFDRAGLARAEAKGRDLLRDAAGELLDRDDGFSALSELYTVPVRTEAARGARMLLMDAYDRTLQQIDVAAGCEDEHFILALLFAAEFERT